MKLEVENYIRTTDGKIFKTNKNKIFTSNDKKTLYIQLNGINNHAYYEIKKVSFNIIDLIEEGDYVNGARVKGIGLRDIVIEPHEVISFKNIKINEILTKEQYNANIYKL